VTIEGKGLRPILWVVLDDETNHQWDIWAVDITSEKKFTQLVYHYPYEMIIVNYGVKIDTIGRIDQSLI
jgi:hypothetical protein